MFDSILSNVRTKNPIVHNITNYVTVNDCANILLAVGASPIMADDIAEVEDITAISSALVINMGTLNERTIESMVRAGMHANKLGIPVIFDPVGAGASRLRNETLVTLFKNIRFSVIRGNISEIHAVAKGSGKTRGVDAAASDAINEANLHGAIEFAKSLAKKLHTVIAISGAIDIVTNGDRAYVIYNGHPVMARITGSGCMSTAVCGAFVGANPENILDATATAVCAVGICGERAAKICEKTGTFRTLLIDEMSVLDENTLTGGLRCEAR